MPRILQRWFEKSRLRKEKIQEAREKFTSWLEISESNGWKAYQNRIDKKIESIDNQFHNEISLSGEDLKRLQLAYQVYKEVKRIPQELKDNAKGGVR